MKFIIVQDSRTGWSTWTLVTNAEAIIASSSSPYQSIDATQQAIAEFKAWVQQAPVEIAAPHIAKDWRQQAMDQLKKTPWVKG